MGGRVWIKGGLGTQKPLWSKMRNHLN
ncbi:hypothetical protein CCACVL1_26475 [Corchorus capsularis]|uniref:Uncharacterized protein n=1 Tax=Corchorus capsularis TaxID=210143 RepID=A0A1R3GEM3_COCAP|nr:hypothetical protein CCACVL1_26475 [Corchorus capsularis]